MCVRTCAILITSGHRVKKRPRNSLQHSLVTVVYYDMIHAVAMKSIASTSVLFAAIVILLMDQCYFGEAVTVLDQCYFGEAMTDPKPNKDSVVKFGNARFTILTDHLIRMEWNINSQFNDAATFAFINRNLPVSDYNVCHVNNVVTIQTPALKVLMILFVLFTVLSL